MNMESSEIREKIIGIFETHKAYGGEIILKEGCKRVPPDFTGTQMVFTFADTTDNHYLSLKWIADGLNKIGRLNILAYHGLKGANTDQRVPEIRFNVTIEGGNYEIIFVLP